MRRKADKRRLCNESLPVSQNTRLLKLHLKTTVLLFKLFFFKHYKFKSSNLKWGQKQNTPRRQESSGGYESNWEHVNSNQCIRSPKKAARGACLFSSIGILSHVRHSESGKDNVALFHGRKVKICWNAHQIADHYTVIDVPSTILCLLPSVSRERRGVLNNGI